MPPKKPYENAIRLLECFMRENENCYNEECEKNCPECKYERQGALELAIEALNETTKQGRYIEAKVGGMLIYPDNQKMCSLCKTVMPSMWVKMPPFCFGCGAKMEEEK